MLAGSAVRASALKNLLPKSSGEYKRVALHSWNAVNRFNSQSEKLPAHLFAPKTFKASPGSFIEKRFYCDANSIPIVDYKEVKDLPKHPEKLLIDVREPEELVKYGKIPTSINIPLRAIKRAFTLPEKYFKMRYEITKPNPEACIIFSSRSGGESEKAAIIAKMLGYQNVKYYKGSWADWAEHEKIPIPSS